MHPKRNQANSFNAIGELRNPTPARERTVAMCVPVLPLLLYLTVAICGYLTFGNLVKSNVMNTYPHTPLLSMARAVLGVVVLCNVPLNIFPSRVSTLSLMSAFSRSDAAAQAGDVAASVQSAASGGAEHARLFISTAKKRCLTALFLVLTGGTALLVNDLGVVVVVIGSTGATLIALVCPPAAYLLLARRGEKAASHWVLHILAAAMLLIGLFIVPSKLFCT